MDMKISGSGNIASGEYDKVRISGSGRLSGFVRCESFHSSGSSKGEEIECQNEFHVSGSNKFSGNVKAGNISVSGSFDCNGNVSVKDEFKCSGVAKVEKNVKSGVLSVSGGLKVGGDVEAESVTVSGRINCDGLVNAEEITIKFDYGMNIGSIGGSKIVIFRDRKDKSRSRLPLLASMMQGTSGDTVCVKNSIEGDNIAVENVECPRVSGRVVAIGEGCNIDLVQYSEEIEVSSDAKVGKTEKI